MRSTNIVRLSSFVVACVLASGCLDPEKAVLAIFSKQGLTLLKPARDYVTVGGLVTATGGRARYDDPFDAVPATAPVAFNAIIPEETKKDTAQFGVVFSQLANVVPLPVGLKVDSSIEVKLAAISSRGQRLRSTDLLALANRPETQQQAFQALSNGGRAFLVQDVYLGKSVSVNTTRKGGLQATLGGAEVPSCSTAPAPTPALPAAAASGNSTPSTNPAAGSPQPAIPPTKNDAAQLKPSVGVTACREGNYSLRFSSDTDIPFAVRLVELAIAKTKDRETITFKTGGRNLGGTLNTGAGTPSSFVDSTNPAITALDYQPRAPKR